MIWEYFYKQSNIANPYYGKFFALSTEYIEVQVHIFWFSLTNIYILMQII